MIRDDIQEALDNGAVLFEFEGDYNYKTLAENAREVVKTMKHKWVAELHKNFKEENYTDEEKNINGFYVFYKSSHEYKDFWITIVTCRYKELCDDHPRVFCRIDDPEAFNSKVIADCKEKLNKARQEHRLVDGKWEWKKS